MLRRSLFVSCLLVGLTACGDDDPGASGSGTEGGTGSSGEAESGSTDRITVSGVVADFNSAELLGAEHAGIPKHLTGGGGGVVGLCPGHPPTEEGDPRRVWRRLDFQRTGLP